MKDLFMIYKLILQLLIIIPLLLIMAHNKLNNKKFFNNSDDTIAIAIATNQNISSMNITILNGENVTTRAAVAALTLTEHNIKNNSTFKNSFNETETIGETIEKTNKTSKFEHKIFVGSGGGGVVVNMMKNKNKIAMDTSKLIMKKLNNFENITISATILTTSSTASTLLPSQSSTFSTTTTPMRNYLNTQNSYIAKYHRNKTETRPTFPKPQKTDAPMLNYIFDSFSTANKHHHHDQRYGPHFEDIIITGNVTNITIQSGTTIYLNCRISLLQDKTVSWVKRKPGNNNNENHLELLTVGMHTYSGDNRYTVEFQYPNNWRLKITTPIKSDEGTYECQVSTYPPRVIQINLYVNAPEVVIVDEFGVPLQEKYYEIDSTLQLFCIIRNVVMSASVVLWSHGDQILNYDTTRGGVSVKTDLMENGANSTLSIARINKSDSGSYSCSIDSSHEYNITVHILNGESFAELHHGSSNPLVHNKLRIYLLLIFFILQYKFMFSIR